MARMSRHLRPGSVNFPAAFLEYPAVDIADALQQLLQIIGVSSFAEVLSRRRFPPEGDFCDNEFWHNQVSCDCGFLSARALIDAHRCAYVEACSNSFDAVKLPSVNRSQLEEINGLEQNDSGDVGLESASCVFSIEMGPPEKFDRFRAGTFSVSRPESAGWMWARNGSVKDLS